ncbi:MAG: GreA/GreB family elongation factor [Candidatus Nanopelagicales bacterium]
MTTSRTRKAVADRAGDVSTVALTADGRRMLEERVAMIRDVSLPLLRPLLAVHDRDERDVAEFERLVEEQGRLEALLAAAITLPEENDGTVRCGTRLLIELPEGEQVWIRPVHPAEAFLDDERVSTASPVSKAVLGARAGDVVPVTGPAGTWDCRVVAVGEVLPKQRRTRRTSRAKA